MFRKLRTLYRRWFRYPMYVIIYDSIEDYEKEQYYGYFASAAEAQSLWNVFVAGREHLYENVKLCLVVENWSHGNG